MKKGNILVSVLFYLTFITIVVFTMFGKLEITKNEFIDLQKTEKARINAINASNLAKAYISNYADSILGLLRIAGFSSHQTPPSDDIKIPGDSIVSEIMAEIEKKSPEMISIFKDQTREDHYDWIWIAHKNFVDQSDPLNSINLIRIIKNDQEYGIEDVVENEGILDLFAVFAKDNKNIALLLSRSKFSNKSFIVYSLVGKDTLAKYGTFLNSWPEDGYWTSDYKFYGDVRLNEEPLIHGNPEIFGDYYAPDLNDDEKNWRGSGSFKIEGENYFIGGDELEKYNFDGISKDYGKVLEFGSSKGNESDEGNPFTLVIDIARMKGDAEHKKWVENLYKLIKPQGYMKGLWIRNKIVRILIPERLKVGNSHNEIEFPIRVLADVNNDGLNEQVEMAIAVGDTESSNFSNTDEIVVAFKDDENSPDITLKFLDKNVDTNYNTGKNYTGYYVYFDSSTGNWRMFESPIATVAAGEAWPEDLDPSTLVVYDVKLLDSSNLDLNPSNKIYEIVDATDHENRTSPYWKKLRIYTKDLIKNRENFVFETFPFQFNGIIDFDKHDVILGDISGSTNEDLCLVNGKYTVYTKNNIYQISSIIYQDYAEKVKEKFGVNLNTAAQIIDNYPYSYGIYDLGDGRDLIDFLRNNSSQTDDFLNLICEGDYYVIGDYDYDNEDSLLVKEIKNNDNIKLFGSIYVISRDKENRPRKLSTNFQEVKIKEEKIFNGIEYFSQSRRSSNFYIYGSGILQTEGITESGSVGYSIIYIHDERIKRGIAAWNYGTPGAPSEIQVYGMGVLEK